MSGDGDVVFLSFRCPQCDKRLKVAARHVGRTVSCPRCGARFPIPAESGPSAASENAASANGTPLPTSERAARQSGSAIDISDLLTEEPAAESPSAGGPPSPPSAQEEEDVLKLATPAIGDVDARVQSAKDAKEAKRRQQQERSRRRSFRDVPPGKVEPVQSARGKPPSPSAGASSEATAVEPAAKADQQPSGTIFDDDLPALQEIEDLSSKGKSEEELLAAALGYSADDESAYASMEQALDEELGAFDVDGDPYEDAAAENYRITCPTCGTPQYVSLVTVGKKVKCPDCFSQFTVPQPPRDFVPKKTRRPQLEEDGTPRIQETAADQDTSDLMRRGQTQEILKRAAQELSEEEKDELYRMEFDTAGFFRRTFGFLTDLIVVSQIVGYGLVYALIFALFSISFADTDSYYGRGLLLVSFILAPLVLLLFGLPMISGGLSLIESVANKQPRQEAIPSFNVFENFGELLLLAVAIGVSAAPGFIIGGIFAGEDPGQWHVRLICTMSTLMVLLPVVLLSMLEEGSLFSVVSPTVLRSIPKALEAWGAYYLKVLAGYGSITVFWLMLLGFGPIGFGIIGATVPLLFFFTCQQLGLLADDISDELSVAFTPGQEAEEEQSDEEDEDQSRRHDLDDLES
ncbi:MAG: hypothetical protein KatS3mg111_0307 [Pirellulaceae bacterium]|nr:MAG: hypothetical protein KatS3mg111_0307 [Pirellulaceae bacterium]